MASSSNRYSNYSKKYKAPQINLSFKREYDLIYSYFNIGKPEVFNFDDNPRKTAICKVCDDKMGIICGSGTTSSYTFILTNHLRKHGKEYEDYLIEYSLLMKPDTKNIHEHFDEMTRPRFSVDEELSSLKVRECDRNWDLNPRNVAGVHYSPRDFSVLKRIDKELLESDNAKMLDFIHDYSNQQVKRTELMGTELMGKDLLKEIQEIEVFGR